MMCSPHLKFQELCTGKAKGAISNYEDIASALNCNILTQKGISFLFIYNCFFYFSRCQPKIIRTKTRSGDRNVMSRMQIHLLYNV